MTLEEIQDRITSLQHKDRLTNQDYRELSDMHAILEVERIKKQIKIDDKPKDVYGEFYKGVLNLQKPNGTWKSNSSYQWRVLRDEVLRFIALKQEEREGKNE